MKKNLTTKQKDEIKQWFLNHSAMYKAPKSTIDYLKSILTGSNNEEWHFLNSVYINRK